MDLLPDPAHRRYRRQERVRLVTFFGSLVAGEAATIIGASAAFRRGVGDLAFIAWVLPGVLLLIAATFAFEVWREWEFPFLVDRLVVVILWASGIGVAAWWNEAFLS
jgi:hypothetical protein